MVTDWMTHPQRVSSNLPHPQSDCLKMAKLVEHPKAWHHYLPLYWGSVYLFDFFDYTPLGKLPEADPYTLQPQTVIINNCISEKAKCLTMTWEAIGR